MKEIQNRMEAASDSNNFFVAKRNVAVSSIAYRLSKNVKGADKTGTLIEVDAAHLHPSQGIVFESKIEAIKEALLSNNGTLENYPIGTKVGEEVYIFDGHHRSAAQIALYGKAKIQVIEVPEEEVKERLDKIAMREKHPDLENTKQNNSVKQPVGKKHQELAAHAGKLREYIVNKLKNEEE